jgi:hypothetical protein
MKRYKRLFEAESVDQLSPKDKKTYDRFLKSHGIEYANKFLKKAKSSVDKNIEKEVYNKILQLLKDAVRLTTTELKKNSLGADKYPSILIKNTKELLNKEYPKVFTNRQIETIFNGKYDLVMDQADYLTNIYMKKVK